MWRVTASLAVKRVLLIVAVTAVALAAPGTASAATNLLTNPGFEQGLTGWHVTNGHMKLAAPHTGTYSLQLYGATRELKMTVQPQVIPVASSGPAELYEAGAWVYAPRQYQRLCVMIDERDASGTFVRQTASCIFVQHAREWEHIHAQWENRVAGHSFTVAVQARGPRAGDWFDVDDVTLTVGLLPNPVVPPTLTGGAQVGHTLTVDTGSWQNGPLTFTYDWLACLIVCRALQRDTPHTASYVVQPEDVGWTIEAGGSARNSVGLTWWATAPTAPVTS